MSQEKNIFLQVLDRELIPALGCTEPVGFALITAIARKYAPGEVKRIDIECDGLDAVGVQAVGIPKTNGKHGGYLSSALGVIAGRPELGMLVLDNVTEADVKAAEEMVARGICSVEMVVPGASKSNLYIRATVETDQHTAVAMMEGSHDESCINYIEADGEVILDKRVSGENQELSVPYQEMDFSVFNLDHIYDFCKTCAMEDLGKIREAIRLNRRVCEDGLENPLGLQVARTLKENVEKGAVTEGEIAHILTWTISGLDARMGGSDYPAMINTGSGNQGIIVTIAPVAAAEYTGRSEDEAIRAAAMANLVNIWIHYHSQDYAYAPPQCYCGTSACTAAACGVAFLHGFTKKQIADIVCTSMGILPGVICDGAKPSCALRAMTGLSGALEAMMMAEKGIRTSRYDGLVNDSPEVTMNNIYRLQKDCMDTKMSSLLWKIKKEQNTIC